MNVFKEITALLGWLAGSLAGIAAVFYACGYLIKRAHLNLLGISALFSYSEEQYMQEGPNLSLVLNSEAKIPLQAAPRPRCPAIRREPRHRPWTSTRRSSTPMR